MIQPVKDHSSDHSIVVFIKVHRGLRSYRLVIGASISPIYGEASVLGSGPLGCVCRAVGHALARTMPAEPQAWPLKDARDTSLPRWC